MLTLLNIASFSDLCLHVVEKTNTSLMPHRAVFITLSHYCRKGYCRHNNYCDTEAIIIVRLFDSNSVNISSCIKPNGTVNNVLNEIEKDVKRLTKKDYVIIAAVTNIMLTYL